jgi:hypothetical protein
MVLMPMMLDGNHTKAASSDGEAEMMHAVAGKLRDMGIDVRFPDDAEGRCLVIVNAKDARSDITVEDCGCLVWDYWPLSSSETDPADITGMVLGVLGGHVTDWPPPASRAPTLKSAVGQALQAYGLDVTMSVYGDNETFEVTSEITAISPELPECGRVLVTDDGLVTWELCHGGPPSECALNVADTIVPVLIHGIKESWPSKRAS